MNWLKIILLGISMTIVWTAYYFLFTTGHPSDKKLLTNFEHNRSKYETLVTMFQQDSSAQAIAPNWMRPDDVITQDRWDDYKALFFELELEGGLRSHGDGSIQFISSASGLPSASSGKGFMFRPGNPQVIYDNLDKFHDNRMSFLKIDDDWYIFLHWTD